MRFARCLFVFAFLSHSVACLESETDPEVDTEEPTATPDELDADELALTADDDAAPLDDDAATYDTDDIDPALLPDDADDPAGDDEAALELASAKPLLAWGLHQRASDALRAAGVHANRIMQTIGNARASAGYHRRDGYFHGKPYTAAVDLSVRGLSHRQIRNLLERLGKVGYAGWFRWNGHDGWYGVNHIHAVYARCKMKYVLRAQIHSWLAGRNGLGGNAIYHFHTFSHAAKATVRSKFHQSRNGTSNR